VGSALHKVVDSWMHEKSGQFGELMQEFAIELIRSPIVNNLIFNNKIKKNKKKKRKIELLKGKNHSIKKE